MSNRDVAAEGGHRASSRGGSRLVGIAIALALVVASWPSVSYASNFGSACAVSNGVPNCISLGNSSLHHYWFGNVETDQRNAMNWIAGSVYSATDLTSIQSAHSNTDVKIFDNTYGANGIWGWVDCGSTCEKTGTHPNRTGFKQDLRFNLSYPTAFDTQFERRYMACHEFGHTVGLRHTNSLGDPYNNESCMFANAATSNVLTPHDIGHIDAEY